MTTPRIMAMLHRKKQNEERTMNDQPSPKAVEAALAYSSMNHKVDAISEDVQRILWANVQPDCTGYSSAYALTAARILAAEVERLRAENEKLRVALAMSDQPCAYCTLPKDEWAKCKSGFPGCARSDDAMGCPELGAALEAERLRARVAELEDELQRRHTEYSKALNRRCTVEDALYDVAAGKRDLLTREECRELAIKLGVPPAEPK